MIKDRRITYIAKSCYPGETILEVPEKPLKSVLVTIIKEHKEKLKQKKNGVILR